MSNDSIIAFGVGALLTAGGLLIGNAAKKVHVNQVAVDKAARESVDAYFREHPIHVSESTLAGAVDRAVDGRVRTYVDRVQTDISNTTRSMIQKRVNETWEKEENELVNRFADEINGKIYRLNRDDIEDKVVEKVVDNIEDKVDDYLDSYEIKSKIEEGIDNLVTERVHDEVRRRAFRW